MGLLLHFLLFKSKDAFFFLIMKTTKSLVFQQLMKTVDDNSQQEAFS
jgi:hypothetical protein